MSKVTVVDPLTYTMIMAEQSLRDEIDDIEDLLLIEERPLMVKWLNIKLGRRKNELEGVTAMLDLLQK